MIERIVHGLTLELDNRVKPFSVLAHISLDRLSVMYNCVVVMKKILSCLLSPFTPSLRVSSFAGQVIQSFQRCLCSGVIVHRDDAKGVGGSAADRSNVLAGSREGGALPVEPMQCARSVRRPPGTDSTVASDRNQNRRPNPLHPGQANDSVLLCSLRFPPHPLFCFGFQFLFSAFKEHTHSAMILSRDLASSSYSSQ